MLSHICVPAFFLFFCRENKTHRKEREKKKVKIFMAFLTVSPFGYSLVALACKMGLVMAGDTN